MSQVRTLWDEGRLPGREVVALGAAVLLTVVLVDLMLAGHLSLFFDLCFVTLCVGLALAVRPRDFFTVGVLPPLLMLLALLLLAVADPGAVARSQDGVVQALVTGLSSHSGALVSGYLLCLGALLVRDRVAVRRAVEG